MRSSASRKRSLGSETFLGGIVASNGSARYNIYRAPSSRALRKEANRKQNSTTDLPQTRTATASVHRLRSHPQISTGRNTGRTTARTRGTTATMARDLYIVALIENKNKEVGLAAYNLRSFEIELRQYSDLNCFSKTMTALTVFSPIEVVLSQSSASGALDHAIGEKAGAQDVKISFIGRKYFNETTGALTYEKLSAESCPLLDSSSQIPKYLALAACSALVKYVEHIQAVTFEPKSMRIRLQPNSGTLFLDINTIEAVELIANARFANQTTSSRQAKKECLLGLVDKTNTYPGRRLVRRTLLEPPNSAQAIHDRQDALEELSQREDGYFALCKALGAFPDIESALACLLAREDTMLSTHCPPTTSGVTCTGSQHTDPRKLTQDSSRWSTEVTVTPPSMTVIRNVLCIKSCFDVLPELLRVVEQSSSSLLLGIAETFRCGAFTDLVTEIAEALDECAGFTRNTESMRIQSAYAIRTGRNGHLDLARKRYSENVEDMQEYLEQLKEQLEFPTLTLAVNAKRGYHMTAPSSSCQKNALHDEFVQVQKVGKQWRMSTNSLIELNTRANEALADIWDLTERELNSLLKCIWRRDSVLGLHRLCDSIALLDAIVSMVTYSSLCPVSTVRPKITSSGPIAIKEGYHPMLLDLNSEECVPNNTFLNETTGLHIITGRNQAGKSTYMRSVALLTILAHTGCSIPASFASVRLLQNVCTRFNTSDSIAASQSHHSREMQEMGAILKTVTSPCKPNGTHPNSLVLVDELGRSTSTLDGFSIAYAVAEKVAHSRNVLCMFTTHFVALGALRMSLPFVSTFHMVTHANTDAEAAPQPVNFQMTTQNENGESFHCPRLPSQPLVDNPLVVEPVRTPPTQSTTAPGAAKITYTYKITNGDMELTRYGIEVAAAAGFPASVIADAQNLCDMIPARLLTNASEFAQKHLQELTSSQSQKRLRHIVRVAQKLSRIRNAMPMMNEEAREHLKSISKQAYSKGSRSG